MRGAADFGGSIAARVRGLVLLLGAVAGGQAALAHKPSDAYLTLAASGTDIAVRWDVALRDLDRELGLDADDDGRLTWGEVRARQQDIAAFLLPQLQLRSGGQPCVRPDAADPAAAIVHQIDQHSDGAYEVLRFTLRCVRPVAALDVAYRLFAASDPTHRGIVRVEAPGQDGTSAATAVLGPDHPQRTFELRRAARLETLREFVWEGIRHIWLGFDHILFLLSLLLPSVLVRDGARGAFAWRGAATLRPAIGDVLKVVTAFTLAHSLTLGLAVLDVVTLPSRLVESAIALTVVLASLNNLRPVVRERRWLAAFAFGLIHGFGFASALKDLGLASGALALSLFGFNVGVEIGQLALVAVFFPVAFALRETRFYRRAVLGAGSAAVAGIAALWLCERVFDIRLIGFGA